MFIAMMQTLGTYGRPFPEHWFSELSHLCRESGLALQAIGAIDPNLDFSQKQSINNYFDAEDYNVAMIPEEVSRAVSEFGGGCLHAIGPMLTNPFVSPVVVAPLARTVVENSCLLLYLNRFDPIERTFWAMRSLTEKMNYEKERDLVPGLYHRLKGATKIHTSKHRGKKFGFPSNTKLVSETLKDIDGAEIYRVLSSYTHQHTWTAYKHFTFANNNPVVLELRSLLIVLDMLTTVERAARSLASRRPRTDVLVYVEAFDAIILSLNRIGADLQEWMRINGLTPAP